MRKLTIVYMVSLLCLFLLLMSCQKQTLHLELDVVDSLCYIHPEKAMEMLEHYQSVKGKAPHAVQMRYDLLQTKARDKAMLLHTSDSVMKQVVAYYEEHGTVNERLESMYYMGSVYRDLHDSPRALSWYLRATAWGEAHIHEVDSIILRNVYAQLAWVYQHQYNYTDALEANKREYRLSADSITDPLTMMDLANSYMHVEKTDTGGILYDRALSRILELHQEIPYMDLIATQLAHYSGHYHQQEKAEERLTIILQHPETHHIYNVYSALASYYEVFGPPDSAIYYYRKVMEHKLPLTIRADAAMRLTLNFHYLHQKDSVDKYAIQYIILNDSVYGLQKWEETKLVQNEFQYQRNKEAEAEAYHQAAEEKNRRQFVIIMALGLLLLMTALLLWREKIVKAVLEKKNLQIQKAEQQLSIKESEITASKDLLTEREQQLEQTLERNQELSSRWEMEQEKTEVVELSELTEALKKVAAGHRVGMTKRELMRQLFHTVDAMYPAFGTGLKQQMVTLSKDDLSMAYLDKAGISQANIAKLLSVNASTVYRHLQKIGRP